MRPCSSRFLAGTVLLLRGTAAIAFEPMAVPLHCEFNSPAGVEPQGLFDAPRFNLVVEDVGNEHPYCLLWEWGDRNAPSIGDGMTCMKMEPAQGQTRYVDGWTGDTIVIQPDGGAIYTLSQPISAPGTDAKNVVVTHLVGVCKEGAL